MATSFSVGTSANLPLGANFARDVIRVGVIGYGYWGPNIVRNFQGHEKADVVAVCDKNPKSLSRVRRAHPEVPVTSDQMEVLTSTQVDVVAVVTPVWTHFELAKLALENGKHVFVEKPFTCTTAQAEQLIELAERKNLKIMVDHTFLFTGAVKRIKQFVDDGTLGPLYYYDSTRVNLGLFQHDCNVNWLSPVKVRTTLLGGEKKMLVWNDLEADEKVKVYDRGVQMMGGEAVYQQLVSYRTGDMWSPNIEQIEALKVEASYFIDCIRNNKRPFNDGEAGLRIVRMLEAADQSLKPNRRRLTLYV